jgi:hypothetical protein
MLRKILSGRAIRGGRWAGFTGILVGLAALTPTLPTAAQSTPPPSFCGRSSQGTRPTSVWQAIKNYQTRVGEFTPRNCLWCHKSNGGLPVEYVKAAFEIDILADWLKSSYWAPGSSKAQAAVLRMSARTMPPGAWETPEAEHSALMSKIAEWIFRMPECNGNAACIWGDANTDRTTDMAADPTGGLQRCTW